MSLHEKDKARLDETAANGIILVPEGHLKSGHLRAGRDLAAFRSISDRSIDFDGPGMFGAWDRVVVTGGSGCIGTEVLKLLRAIGVSRLVSISDLSPDGSTVVPSVEYLNGDVTDRRTMEELLRSIGPELVIHLAGIRDPALAEGQVVQAIESNIIGTEIVMDAARNAGVSVVVVASTGKAMRLFTSDIYASSKQMIEYLVSRAGFNGEMKTGCARFTHVVDNSLVYRKMCHWARLGKPIILHGPNVDLFVQSAREAAELLLITARMTSDEPASSAVSAITDLGWPPIDLLGLAKDIVSEARSRSAIVSTYFPPGYEEGLYPGTVDPKTAGDNSPLFNALESQRSAIH